MIVTLKVESFARKLFTKKTIREFLVLNYCNCSFLLNPTDRICAFTGQRENSCEKTSFFNKNRNFNSYLRVLLIVILIPTPNQPWQDLQ